MSGQNDVVIRETIGPGDVAAVGNLVERTGFFNPEETAIASELVQESLDRGEAAGYRFIMAERAGTLLGYSCFGRIPCTTASWDLYWIAVDPAAQGSGLGRRILARTEDRIREAAGHACYAETSGRPLYGPTRAFYERTGYATGAVFPDFYGPGDDKYVFVKVLD